MKFRKKIAVIEAVQWLGTIESFQEVKAFHPLVIDLGKDFNSTGSESWTLNIRTPEGNKAAEKGDWIIKGLHGFYACKPDIFEATYEPL